MWKEVLDFDMQAKGTGTPVKNLVSGKTFGRPTGGFVGVSNVGRDVNWLGHHLAMANLYAFGRLAWNPDLSSKQIAEEWTRQTFGGNPSVTEKIVDILMKSWPIYESYTGPFGIGTLTDIINIHFGPAPESSEYNGWGQWHRANETGVGMDRTVGTGTRYIGQYRPPVAAQFESLSSCPEDLLLFMHHVPYTHRLHSGKTLIQQFYNLHYQGAEDARGLVDQWRSLEHHVDDQRYHEVLDRLEFQAGHAQGPWRDSICRWFMKRDRVSPMRRAELETIPIAWRPKTSNWTVINSPRSNRGKRLPGAEPRNCRAILHRVRFDSNTAARKGHAICGFSTSTRRMAFQNSNCSWWESWLTNGRPITTYPRQTTLPDAHSSNCRMIRRRPVEGGRRASGSRVPPIDGERTAVDYFRSHARSRQTCFELTAFAHISHLRHYFTD